MTPAGRRVRHLRAPGGNLPHAVTSFVGRTQEIADLRAMPAGNRLVTLTGTGACGKTRLTLAAHNRTFTSSTPAQPR